MRQLHVAGLAGLGLFLVLVAPSIAKADNCGSLLASINQLKAQIPREPRDAAADDRQVLDNYVGLYNRACTGGGSSPGGGYGGVPRGNNNLANGLGAAANALNALSDLADELDREQQEEDAARQQQEEQDEMDAALEQAREEAAQRAAEAQERAAEAAARSADDAQRQAMANPFAGSSASGGGAANPFAGKGQSANPFASTAAAGSAPKATAPSSSTAASKASAGTSSKAGGGAGGFKSDAQIAADCANAGNPDVCKLLATTARSQSPAYRQYAAQQKKTIQKNVDDAQQRVNQAFKDFDNQKAKRTPPDQLGALPKILAGIPPDNDEGDECGPLGYGRRHGGQCMFPWTQSPEACAAANGSYYAADDDHPTAFCGTGAPANPMTAYPGPNEGAQCGDVAGHIHGGACWALGITHDDCDDLHGVIMDNGGLQYCAYNADEVAQEQAAAADVLRRAQYLEDLRKKLAGGDVGTPGGGGPTTTNPIVPITTTPGPGGTAAPAPDKQAWTPDYECRLANGTVFHTDDPSKIGGDDPNDGTQGNGVGFDPLHKWDCHLTNGRPIIGLTPNSPDK